MCTLILFVYTICTSSTLYTCTKQARARARVDPAAVERAVQLNGITDVQTLREMRAVAQNRLQELLHQRAQIELEWRAMMQEMELVDMEREP